MNESLFFKPWIANYFSIIATFVLHGFYKTP